MKLFKTDGILYKAMILLYQLLMLNILWCIFSIPLFTIGASTTALYFVLGKIIRREEVSEFRDFYRSFRQNFKHATGIFFILCAAYLVIYTNLNFLQYTSGFSTLLFLIQIPVLLQVAIITLVVFPILSRYDLTVVNAIKISWIIGTRHFFSCLLCIAAVAVIFLLVKAIPAVLLLCLISLMAMSIYGIFNNVLEKYRSLC